MKRYKFSRNKVEWDIGTIIRCLPTYEKDELETRLEMLRDEVIALADKPKKSINILSDRNVDKPKECKHKWLYELKDWEDFTLDELEGEIVAIIRHWKKLNNEIR